MLRDLSVRRGIYIDRKHLTAVPPLGNGIVDPTPLSKITFKFKDMDGRNQIDMHCSFMGLIEFFQEKKSFWLKRGLQKSDQTM